MAKEIELCKQVCSEIGVKFEHGTQRELNTLDNTTDTSIFFYYDTWRNEFEIGGQPHSASGAQKNEYTLFFDCITPFNLTPTETVETREKVVYECLLIAKKFLYRLWLKSDVDVLYKATFAKVYNKHDFNGVGVGFVVRIQIDEPNVC